MSKIMDNASISEIYKQMRDHAASHYGIPNGEDFPIFAKAISDCKDMQLFAIMHFLLVGMSLSEISNVMKSIGEDLSPITKVHAFQGYLEVMYFGYKLGRQAADLEKLEQMATVKADAGNPT